MLFQRDLMERQELLTALQQALPVEARRAKLGPGNVGLVVVDVVRGFTREGNLSDAASMAPMVQAVDAVLAELDEALGPRLRLLLLRDTHHADIPEPPYPPHCIKGSGEDELDPVIAHAAERPGAVVLDKDCINGFVGAMEPDGEGRWRNRLCDWVVENQLTTLILVGDCTDICVSDLAVALLSARNHGMLTDRDPQSEREAYVAAITGMQILVHAGACATYDLDPPEPFPAGQEGLRHPGAVAHHVGLWVAASRGAGIVDGFEW